MTKKIFALFLVMSLCLLFCAQVSLAAAYRTSERETYKLQHHISIVNTGSTSSRNVYVRVPLISEDQPVYQELRAERYSREPLLIYRGADNNRYALFSVARLDAGQSLSLNIDYYLYNSLLFCDIDAQEYGSGDVSGVSARYLAAEENVETQDADIIAYAEKFTQNGADNFYSLAKKAFADINLYMTYGSRADGRSGAVAALQTGVGQCRDYASLYVAVLRVMGIPARFQTGYYFEPDAADGGEYIELSQMAHTWTEFYLPAGGWVIADPTFTYTVNMLGTEQKLVNWDYFANISASRRYFYFLDSAAIPDISYEYSGGPLSVDCEARLYLHAELVPFRDVTGHWAESDINYLYARNIVGGTSADTFEPSRTVTRAEIAAMLYRAAALQPSGYGAYADVAADAWYAQYIGAVSQSGLMIGSPDGSFRPNDRLSRAELAVIICRLIGIGQQLEEMPFEDIDASYWAAGAISSLYAHGMTAGVSPGIFGPALTVTRAEAAAFISRALQYK